MSSFVAKIQNGRSFRPKTASHSVASLPSMIHPETIQEQRLSASTAHMAQDVVFSCARPYSIHDDYAGVTPNITITALESAPRMQAATKTISQNTSKLIQASQKSKNEEISIQVLNHIPTASDRFWQDRVDETVKAYIRASDDFVAKLLVLRDKANGKPQYTDSIDEMMQKAAQRRMRIAIEGEKAYTKFVRHVKNASAELGHGNRVAVFDFAVQMADVGERLDKGED